MTDLETWERGRVEMLVAERSAHPLVRSALGDLQVAVTLAHATEIEQELAKRRALLSSFNTGAVDTAELVILLVRETIATQNVNTLAALRNFVDVAIY